MTLQEKKDALRLAGAELVEVDRGGDVTFHGPGQLVAYPIVTVDPAAAGEPAARSTPALGVRDYVHLLESVLIDTIRQVDTAGRLGPDDVGRHDGYPGVWIRPGTADARKVAQVGVRVERGRTMHGVALNVDPDMTFFEHISLLMAWPHTLILASVSASMHTTYGASITCSTSRTMISRLANSTSFTRRRKPSSRRMPVP